MTCLLILSFILFSCKESADKSSSKGLGSGLVVNGADNKVPDDVLASGRKVFLQTCQICHNDTTTLGAPNLGILSRMTPRSIVAALRSGKMKLNAEKLSLEQCEDVAQWITNQILQVTPIPQEAFTSFSLPPGNTVSNWVSGWGGDLESTGFTSTNDAGISLANIKTLKLKWAFAIPEANQMRCRPAIVGNWLITGSQFGDVYAIQKKTGKIGWNFSADAGIRGAIQIGKSGDSLKAYFADYSTNVYALDLRTGRLLWKTRAGFNPQAAVSGSVAVYDNRVYVPLTSYEVISSMNPSYDCCSTSGGVVALDATDGSFVWKHRVIADSATFAGKSKNGKSIFGPSGAPVWCSPTVDSTRGQLLIGTGENYTIPATNTSDAVQALDLKTGKLLWNYQATSHDTWNLACPDGVNCPDRVGQDLDFGMAPILVKRKSGPDIVVAGQKSGVVHALDPATGKLIWKKRIGKGGALGGIHMGMATDGNLVFAPNADNLTALDPTDPSLVASPGLFALDPLNGNIVWTTMAAGCDPARKGCVPANSASPLAIPGIVFAGGLDGIIRAYDAKTGKILWSYDTVKEFQTVNGIRGRGGALDGSSPVASDGMLYVNSGYSLFGEINGNVLLAFEVGEN